MLALAAPDHAPAFQGKYTMFSLAFALYEHWDTARDTDFWWEMTHDMNDERTSRPHNIPSIFA